MSNSANSPIGHAVYFTLKDRTPEAIGTLVAECHQYLDGHDGVRHFSVGVRGSGFDREVNDQEFDVALYVEFDDRASHDVYQAEPRHLEFIERNRESWAKVRVFDSELR